MEVHLIQTIKTKAILLSQRAGARLYRINRFEGWIPINKILEELPDGSIVMDARDFPDLALQIR
jgi:hypothetical protein